MLGMSFARACALALTCLACLPAAAGAFGVQKSFNTPGIQCCGETVVYNAVALEGDTILATAGPRSAVYRYTTAGQQIQAIAATNGTQGMTVDPVHHVVYVIEGGYHSNKDIHRYSSVDGTAIGTAYGCCNFPGDYNEGVNIAVDDATGETYVTANSFGGKIVHFAADGTVLRTLVTGNHPGDIEVDQATGDVVVSEYDSSRIVRYDSQLDNAQTILTAPVGEANPTGLSLAPDGDLWVAWGSTNHVQRFSPAGAVLGTATVPQYVHDVEADAHGGAWVSNHSTNPYTYVATDPPVASFTANPGGDVPTGTHVDFTSTATDADGTIAARTWDLDGDGDCDDATGPTAGRTFATPGTYAIRSCVTDDDGATGTRSLSITVSAQAPSADFSVSPLNPDPGQTITLTSASTDPDDAIVATDWDLDDDGAADDATGSPVTTSFAAAGTYHVRIRVQDAAGNVATRDRAITVGTPGGAGSLSVDDASVTEGNAGTGYLDFHVALAAAVATPVSVDYTVAEGTATDGADFASRSRTTLVFAPGQVSKTVRVPVYGDTLTEPDETVVLTLSDAGGAALADATGTGTIVNDDGLPVLSVAATSAPEGAGDHAQTFTVTLSNPSAGTVTVHYATADGTATAPGDYGASSGTLSFPPFVTSATVPVTVHGDADFENDEAFTLALDTPANATLGGGPATATIVNDDAPPSVSLAGASVTEGNAGTTTLNLPITLSARSKDPVTVHYDTQDGTASAPGDYTAVSGGTVTIPPNTLSGSVPVAVKGDTRFETPDETVRVTAAGVGTATATIVDDDARSVASATSASVAETDVGQAVMVAIALDKPAGSDVLVHWQTAAGTATAGADFASASGDVTFSDGQSTAQVPVQVAGDRFSEADETFTVGLTQGNGRATLAVTPATITITDDDPAPQLTFDGVNDSFNNVVPPFGYLSSVPPAGREGERPVELHPRLSAPLSDPVTVNAVPVTPGGADLQFPAAVTIPAGETTGRLVVAVVDDALIEPTEYIDLKLSATSAVPVDVSSRYDAVTVRVADNDDPPPVTVDTLPAAAEGTGGTPVTRQLAVRLGHPVQYPVSFRMERSPELTDDDTLRYTIPAGSTSVNVPVTARPDALDEDDETAAVTATDFDPAGIPDAKGGVVIRDDDAPHATLLDESGAPAGPITWVRGARNTVHLADDEDFEPTTQRSDDPRVRYVLRFRDGYDPAAFNSIGGSYDVTVNGQGRGRVVDIAGLLANVPSSAVPAQTVPLEIVRSRLRWQTCQGCGALFVPESPVTVASFDVQLVTATAAPASTEPPDVAGSAFPGAQVACDPGSWANDPVSFAYAWKRGSTQVGTGRSYTVSAADVSHSIRCAVTATNPKGSTTAFSAATLVAEHALPGPYSTGPVTVSLPRSGAVTPSTTGTATVPATCTGQTACAVAGTLLAARTARSTAVAAATLGGGKLMLAPGTSGKLKLRLGAAARRRVKHRALKVTLVVTVTSGDLTVTSRRPLTLRRRR